MESRVQNLKGTFSCIFFFFSKSVLSRRTVFAKHYRKAFQSTLKYKLIVMLNVPAMLRKLFSGIEKLYTLLYIFILP